MSENRLAASTSPYLRQHADNPVHWWSWQPEAFAEARARNVPVHLSIGYAACHWCHVMAHESFSDPDLAAYLNEAFVNIKVDREERPDIDQIYMAAIHALGQQGGWPLTMFLSPAGEPFWGGTYFPPHPRHGLPGFRQILQAIAAAWQNQDDAVTVNRQAILDHLKRNEAAQTGNIADAPINESAARILAMWDRENGGIRGAPKFPMSPVLEQLWRSALRTGNADFEAAVLTTLRSLCQGGIYDHIGGGFARYSVDAQWLIPHFEKMLSDNGQLLNLLSLAFGRTGEALFRIRIEETVTWLSREMCLPGGAFAASLDADTDGEEGLTYLWTPAEIKTVLGPDDAQAFIAVYGVTDQGNFEGKTNVNRLSTRSRAWQGDTEEAALAAMREKLYRHRIDRPQPARDDKVLTDWNGAAITALVRAGEVLSRPDWLAMAETAYCFITTQMLAGDQLSHAWFDGHPTAAGLATDYAWMTAAALALHAATGNPDQLADACRFHQILIDRFYDAKSGACYLTELNADLIIRPLSIVDDAMPSATGILAQQAMALFHLTGDPTHLQTANEIARKRAGQIAQNIIGTASIQAGIDSCQRSRLAIVTGTGTAADALKAAVRAAGDPALLLIAPQDLTGLPANHPAQGKAPLGSAPTLYLCQSSSCQPPVTTAADAKNLLTRRPT
ncbi:MAG: thioredoxin domain-containing protein [Alphaproteobacteria bacterium]|nr:MAG: thioredoxin domain-containing protein [Alphaproteobacteria bacterium]